MPHASTRSRRHRLNPPRLTLGATSQPFFNASPRRRAPGSPRDALPYRRCSAAWARSCRPRCEAVVDFKNAAPIRRRVYLCPEDLELSPLLLPRYRYPAPVRPHSPHGLHPATRTFRTFPTTKHPPPHTHSVNHFCPCAFLTHALTCRSTAATTSEPKMRRSCRYTPGTSQRGKPGQLHS